MLPSKSQSAVIVQRYVSFPARPVKTIRPGTPFSSTSTQLPSSLMVCAPLSISSSVSVCTVASLPTV